MGNGEIGDHLTNVPAHVAGVSKWDIVNATTLCQEMVANCVLVVHERRIYVENYGVVDVSFKDNKI